MMTTATTNLVPDHTQQNVESSQPDVAGLVQALNAHAPYDGFFALRMPGVSVVRASRPTLGLVHTTHDPALCIIAQGMKRVLLGQEVYEYDATRMLVVSVDLPVASHILQASTAKPYLSFRLRLDPARIAELVLHVYPHGVPQAQSKRGIAVGPLNAGVVSAATRLIELMAHPGDAELIAPLVIDEILIRLLRSPIGSRVAQIGMTESNIQRIARAVEWVRANYMEPMSVEALADLVHMSVSSFHKHFKAVTSLSPLQYQKVLRLQEARRLMLTTMLDVGTACQRVGYLSTSQFSREYARYFGNAPARDIARLREHNPPTPNPTHELVGQAVV